MKEDIKETEIKYLGQDDIRDFIMKKDYEIYKLQQRIDKAIEYIKIHSKCEGSIQNGKFIIEDIEEIYNGMELLSILRGER